MDELGSICGALMATLVFVENSVGGMFRPPQSEVREEGGGLFPTARSTSQALASNTW